ncbi:hypothetical protein [Chelatococcus sambhunathii]|uniref:hypothetical protein n=1 Tax=Chelatococcus sambhunathii TaxID=363953 RepID=UPI002852B09D|nr:hypothetical protein [Chelatococcus sambhunathii]
MRIGQAALAAFVAFASPALAADDPVYADMKAADLGQGADLNGAVASPADNPWNTDISGEPVDPRSDAIIASIGLDTGIHPDFGSGTYQGGILGIPYFVVGKKQADVKIKFRAYGDQSDKGPYPIPRKADVEGERPKGGSFGGDRHVLVIEKAANRLYELYRAFPREDGGWNADSGAIFHLDSNDVRPTAKPGWTSADAAGLPIFPGLARYEEASAGLVPHALRFTVSRSRRAYVPPATHWASSDEDPDLPPMGMRVRLKAGYDVPKSFSRETKAILKALKTYGMFVADNGSDWYLSGAPHKGWRNGRLASELRQVTGRDFEVVRMQGLVTP